MASKSTSKLSVYKWTSSHLISESHHQNNQHAASKLPAKSPHTKNIKTKNKEEQQRLNYTVDSTTIQDEFLSHGAAAAFPKLVGKAKKLFLSLPDEKRAAISALYYKRAKSQSIENAEAWFIKCIEGNWLEEEKLELPEPKTEPSDFEKNRALAKDLIQKYEGLPDLHICLRNDFLEIGGMKSQVWQIFFCEAPKAFLQKITFVLQQMKIGNLT